MGFPPRLGAGVRTTSGIGFVGRFTPVKAPDVMLDSFAALRRFGAGCYRVLGNGGRWPARTVLCGCGRRLELGLAGEVTWLGARDARPLMAGFDVLALTSKSEGHPLVVLEAMARGLPIVATGVGGIG